MQRRLSTQATNVGVNGDYFSLADGRPSGILLRDGVLATPPNSSRSSAGITLDGLLDVRKVRFLGTWRGTGQRRALNFLNKTAGHERNLAVHPRLGGCNAQDRGFVRRRSRTVLVGDAERGPSRGCRLDVPERARVHRAGNGCAGRARERSSKAPGGGPARDDGDAEAHPPAGLAHRRRRDRWRPRPGPRRRARVPVERGVHDLAAGPARAAQRSRAARRRKRPSRHDRRASARLLRRNDELRARPDAGSARSSARNGARRRRVRDARLRGHRAELAVRRQGARHLDGAHASVLRGVCVPPPLEAVVSPNGDGVAEEQAALVQDRATLDGDRHPHRAGWDDCCAGVRRT